MSDGKDIVMLNDTSLVMGGPKMRQRIITIIGGIVVARAYQRQQQRHSR